MLLPITLTLGIFILFVSAQQTEKDDKLSSQQLAYFLLIQAIAGALILALSYKYLFLVELISPVLQLLTGIYIIVLNHTGTDDSSTLWSRDNQFAVLWANYFVGAFFLCTTWLKQGIFRSVILVICWNLTLSYHMKQGVEYKHADQFLLMAIISITTETSVYVNMKAKLKLFVEVKKA